MAKDITAQRLINKLEAVWSNLNRDDYYEPEARMIREVSDALQAQALAVQTTDQDPPASGWWGRE